MSKVSKQHVILFLVWAPYSPRSENLSNRLNASLYLISYKFKRKFYSPIKYPLLMLRTIKILLRERPDIVITQTPPIFCPLSVFVYNHLFRHKKVKLIIDAHTQTFNKPWTYFASLTKIIMNYASFVIVANSELQSVVQDRYDLKALVLEDMVPEFNILKNSNTEHDGNYCNSLKKRKDLFEIAVLSSFAKDEPIENVLESASQFPHISFYITGDISNLPKRFLKGPANVVFTGFLTYNDYVSLLRQVDAIVVLTNREDTLLAGAYEALGAEKPLISFKSEPLRRYFYKGAVHTSNSSAGISEAIVKVQLEKGTLAEDMHQLKIEKIKQWEEKFYSIRTMLLGTDD